MATLVTTLLSTDDAKNTVVYQSNGNKPAVVSNDTIIFNGKGSDGHETFLFTLEADVEDYVEDKTRAFVFCKTARKPYDKYVTATLVLAKLIFKDDIKVSSDGEISDWQAGKALAEAVWGNVIEIKDGADDGFIMESEHPKEREARILAEQEAQALKQKQEAEKEEAEKKERIRKEQEKLELEKFKISDPETYNLLD